MNEKDIYNAITEIVKNDVQRCNEVGYEQFVKEQEDEYQDMMNFIMGDKDIKHWPGIGPECIIYL